MALFESSIAALGLLIIIGVASRAFLRKTGFSDVFLLLLFGVAAGALLPMGFVSTLTSLAPPFAAITLLMIILDEGLNLSVDRLRRQVHKALLFGAASFALAFAGTFFIAYFIAGQDFFISLIIAALFSSVAPELLAGFLSAFGASKEASALGELEAIFSDSLSVMLTLILVGAYLNGGHSLSPVPYQVAFSVLFSIALGAVFATAWRAWISKSEHENQHLLIIGIAAILYAAAALLGADSVIAVFTFAFFLGNLSHPMILEMRRFQSELSFFLRTFFFIYLGMLLFHSPKPVEVAIIALAISALIAFSRLLSGKLGGWLEPSAKERRLLELVSCRGLSTAVLSVIVYDELLAAGALMPIDLPLLALFVIFFTNLISAFLLLQKGRLKKQNSPSPSLGSIARGGLDSF